MASKGFKLTDNQKYAARWLYRTGRMGSHINGNTIKSLVNKGVIEQKPKGDSWTFYDESFQFTPDGKAWADVEFGTPDPTPPVDPTPGKPETSAPAPDVAAQAAPVASDPVIDAYEQSGSNPLIAQMLLIETAPVADAEIPFATGFIVTDDNDPVMTEIRDAIRASLPVTSDPATRAIWTHRASDGILSMLATGDPIRNAYILRVTRQQDSVATGHGRKGANLPHRRDFSKPMAKVTQLANMQRRTPKTAETRPAKSVIQIAEVLRSTGIEAAA